MAKQSSSERIEAQRKKIADLDEKIGRLMSKRVDAEEKLASMLPMNVGGSRYSLGSYREQMQDAGRGHLLRDTD